MPRPRPGSPPSPAAAPTTGRRSFLQRAAVGGAAITIGPAVIPIAGLLPAATAQQRDDEVLAAFAESLELTLVEVYEAGEPFLSESIAPVAQTFAGHHREHAETFAELAGDRASGRPNRTLLESLAPRLDELSGQAEVLGLLRDLENQVVITYAWALTTLEAPSLIEGVATILPVESAHATTLADALGEGPQGWFPFGAFEPDDATFAIDPATHPVR